MKKDLMGIRFGKLTVVSPSGSVNKRAFWVCSCDCGKDHIVSTHHLTCGKTKSCGCLHAEVNARIFTTHGKSKTAEFKIWDSMRQRCINPNDSKYSYYGGRGITVCERWMHSFENFLVDMGQRPSKDHSIERKENDKGYNPENCKWATRKEQIRNRRNTLFVTFMGETKAFAQWCEEFSLPYNKAFKRYARGIPFERIIHWSARQILSK